jgi:methionyl-tRNA synthetase
MLSRAITLITKNYNSVLEGTAGIVPDAVAENLNLAEFVKTVRDHVEGYRYNLALQTIVQDLLTPTNQYLETHAPWKLVKTDKEAAKKVLFNAVQSLRIASILLKPFIPRTAEALYTSFNFPKPWQDVCYADASERQAQPTDLTVIAELVDGKPKPLFPRISG